MRTEARKGVFSFQCQVFRPASDCAARAVKLREARLSSRTAYGRHGVRRLRSWVWGAVSPPTSADIRQYPTIEFLENMKTVTCDVWRVTRTAARGDARPTIPILSHGFT